MFSRASERSSLSRTTIGQFFQALISMGRAAARLAKNRFSDSRAMSWPSPFPTIRLALIKPVRLSPNVVQNFAISIAAN